MAQQHSLKKNAVSRIIFPSFAAETSTLVRQEVALAHNRIDSKELLSAKMSDFWVVGGASVMRLCSPFGGGYHRFIAWFRRGFRH